MNVKSNFSSQKGNAAVGLLVMMLFVISLVLFNPSNISLTSRVAAATGGTTFIGGGGGGGSSGGSASGAQSVTIGGGATSSVRASIMATVNQIVASIIKVAAKPDASQSTVKALIAQVIFVIQTVVNLIQAGKI